MSSPYNIIVRDVNDMNELEKAKLEVEVNKTVAEIIRSETIDINLRTVAMVRAKYDAYKIVNENFERFVKWQSKNLINYADKPQVMLSLAGLCFDWLAQTKAFVVEMIDILKEEVQEREKDE